MAAIITLTTDFGARDPYVAAVKGVLLAGCPQARLVDLSHEIAAHDIVEGALFLAQAVPWFPAGCVHLAVVDPGVGSERRPLAVAAGAHLFVAPDNGLLALLLAGIAPAEARVIDPSRFSSGGPPSATFHGRDVFAPAASALACGLALSELGPPAGRIATLALPEPIAQADGLRGEVVHVDSFGNLVTNVTAAALKGGSCTAVEVGGVTAGLRRTYAEAPRGEVLALWNGAGLLEVAVREGSACGLLGAGKGTPVRVMVGRPAAPLRRPPGAARKS